MVYQNGIYIQMVSHKNIPYLCKKYSYNGISRHYGFPLSDHQAKKRDLKAYWISKKVKESESGVKLITSFSVAREYIDYCAEIHLPIRCLFIESELSDIRWTGEDLPKTVLGFECAYTDFSDPGFCWYLDNDVAFSDFFHRLNANGLFDTWEDAAAYREKVYETYPEEEEEHPYRNTYLIKISEILNF